MWRGLRRLADGAAARASGPAAVRSSQGVLVVDDHRIADVLAEHYNSVCDPVVFAQGAGFDQQHHNTIEEAVAEMRGSTSFTDTATPQLSERFTDVEVAVAAGKLHNHKAPSPLDAVNNELLKYGGETLHAALAAFFNLQWEADVGEKGFTRAGWHNN